MTHDLLIFGWLHGLLSYQSSQDNNPLSGLWFQRFQPRGRMFAQIRSNTYIYNIYIDVKPPSSDRHGINGKKHLYPHHLMVKSFMVCFLNGYTKHRLWYRKYMKIPSIFFLTQIIATHVGFTRHEAHHFRTISTNHSISIVIILGMAFLLGLPSGKLT